MEPTKTRPEDIRIARPETLSQWDGMGGWRMQMIETKPKITGYRDLSEAEIALINRVKAKAEEVRELVAEIWTLGIGDMSVSHHWLEIGRTDLQKGFMAIIRAIARPETF